MVLPRQANGSTVACQVAVLQVNDSLANQVIRGDHVVVPHLHCEVLVEWKCSCHLKHTVDNMRELIYD